MEKVFVYGSLKKGGQYHSWLKGARFLGEAITCAPYLLYTGWDYPLLVEQAPDEVRRPVCGELYQVSLMQLRRLDEVEDNGWLYQRHTICVQVDAIQHTAWCYFAKAPRLVQKALKESLCSRESVQNCYKFEV